MDPKLAAALDYLRTRNLYLLDKHNAFTYIPSHQTDIRERMGDARTNLRWEEMQRALDIDSVV